jgi:hypothetical protein
MHDVAGDGKERIRGTGGDGPASTASTAITRYGFPVSAPPVAGPGTARPSTVQEPAGILSQVLQYSPWHCTEYEPLLTSASYYLPVAKVKIFQGSGVYEVDSTELRGWLLCPPGLGEHDGNQGPSPDVQDYGCAVK